MRTLGLVLLLLVAPGIVSAQTSPDNARVPPLASVRDSAGAVWTLSGGGSILRSGADSSGNGVLLVIWKGDIYTQAGDGSWWRYAVGGPWVSAPADPSGPPVVPPVVVPVIVGAGTRLAWAMVGTTPAYVASGTFSLYVDAVKQSLPTPTCVIAAPNVTCTHPLPLLAIGVHVLTLTFTVGPLESQQSVPLTILLSAILVPTGFALAP